MLTLFRPGGGEGVGGEVPTLTLNVYNFKSVLSMVSKLDDFSFDLFGNILKEMTKITF